jgi:hypothetical protein
MKNVAGIIKRPGFIGSFDLVKERSTSETLVFGTLNRETILVHMDTGIVSINQPECGQHYAGRIQNTKSTKAVIDSVCRLVHSIYSTYDCNIEELFFKIDDVLLS